MGICVRESGKAAARLAAAGAVCLLVANCGSANKLSSRVDPKYGVSSSPRVVEFGDPVPKGGGTYRVGKPYVGVDVAIRDSAGRPVEAGAPGEVAVRSPAGASGYLRDPETSRAVFRDGLVFTGDVGRQSAEGDLFVLGRSRPMLSVAGKKVSPAEVEACLREHPAVADAVVAGEPTPDGGERIVADVETTAAVTAIELQEHCGRHLASFKVPRRIRLVPSLRRGALGKPSPSPRHQRG